MTSPEDPTVPPTAPSAVRGSAPAPQTLGRYQIRRELARGGMGVVYVAHDPKLHRDVAIKQCLSVADPQRQLDSAAIHQEQQRFLREALAAARLQHANIVSVFDAGEQDDSTYIVMDLVDGESLQDRLEREGPLPEREVARLGLILAQALHYAHARAILHRDVKPHNVLVTADGEPKITDFGLAKVADLRDLETQQDDPSRRTALDLSAHGSLTVTGQLLGTPSFMPPEQAEGQELDARADVYGLGATLYALLTGKPPHTGHTLFNVIHAVLHKPVASIREQRPETDRALEAIVLRALEKEPEARFASCQELANALSAWLNGERRTTRRRRDPASAASPAGLAPVAVGLAVAALAIGLGFWLRGRAPAETASSTPSPPGARQPAPTPSPAPDAASTPEPALSLTESFGWLAPAKGPWRAQATPDQRVEYFANSHGARNEFVRIHRRPGGATIAPSPTWRIVDEAEPPRVEPVSTERQVLVGSPYLLLARTGIRTAQLIRVDDGRPLGGSVSRPPDSGPTVRAALSDAWIVQLQARRPDWRLVAQAIPSLQVIEQRVPGVARPRFRPGLAIGTRVVGVAQAGHPARFYRLPDPQQPAAGAKPECALARERGDPLAISPDDRLVVVRRPQQRRLELLRLPDLSLAAAIEDAGCELFAPAARFSPDGARFAWVNTYDGTVHVVLVANPRLRAKVPVEESAWVTFFWHADTSLTVLRAGSVRRFEVE